MPINPASRETLTVQPSGTTAPVEEPKKDEPKKDEEEKEEKKEEAYLFMKVLQGTTLECKMKLRGISISGWTQMSYTASTADVSNLRVPWNDRANRFLLQQHWIRMEKALDTESKEFSWGWRIDTLIGTDYRFTLPRGLWNGQLMNAEGNQNLYGVDPVQFYLSGYLPNLFEGTEVRVGRLFTPFGYESIEGVNSPLLSRSYAFNWSPPFTHMGIMLMPKFNKNWSGKFMLANGNDVFIDPSEEIRFVGALTWTSCDANDSITFGTSIGRGKFNAGDPFNPTTTSLMTEPAGRNNINVFDLVWTHKLNDERSYAFEAIYGYQTNVPANVPGGIIAEGVTTGTAHWGSIVNYLTYNWTQKTLTILRAEVFEDFQGQRTGFEGLYTSLTAGVQYKPTRALMFRPEIRYDHNNTSNAFEGKNHLWTAAMDMIIRW